MEIVSLRKIGYGLLFGVVFCALLSLSFSALSREARKVHVVQSGESVARIADFYGVSQRDLREYNNLSKDDRLRPGQKLRIPNVLRVSGKKYRVEQGDTLATIAAKHRCEVDLLVAANKITDEESLRIGRILVIPDQTNRVKSIDVSDASPQSILFIRISSGERERLRLYSRSGQMSSRSVQRLSYLSRDKRGEKRVKRLHFRLIKMLQRLGNQFPGKPVEIISGYRPQTTGTESQHAFGRAIDFRMPGVPSRRIFNFCKSLPRSGCGYYPRDGFVHMDARETKVSWVEK